VLAEFQIVQQNDEESLPRTPDSIVSSVAARCIAFVDREADIRVAARSIFQARFMFGGKSSYAPDIVFVHEAAVKLFHGHIAHLWTHLQSKGNGSSLRQPDNGHTAPKASQGLRTLHEGKGGLIVEATDRYGPQDDMELGLTSCRLEKTLLRTSSPALILCSISSSDDGINQWTSISKNGTAAATFIFSTPVEAAYISSSIKTHLTFNNHVPVELLVGPRVPERGSASICPRYEPTMFLQVRPQISHSSAISRAIDQTRLDLVDLETWMRPLQMPLRATGEKPGRRVDFFDQALTTAAGLSLSLIIVSGVVGSMILQRWRAGASFAMTRR
jgi:hypothetical protein